VREKDDQSMLQEPKCEENMMMKKHITTWTPMVLKVKIVGLPIDEAWKEFETIRPTGYVPSVMIKYDLQDWSGYKTRTAHGEIDMDRWAIAEQIQMVKDLEAKGWTWA